MPDADPQPPTPEPETSRPPPDTPSSAPDTRSSKGASNGALFHTLLEAGFDAPAAYTAEKHVNAVSSEAAAAQAKPLMAEIRRMRGTMATKADLADIATTGDLARLETRMVKGMFGALVTQAAFIIAVMKLLG